MVKFHSGSSMQTSVQHQHILISLQLFNNAYRQHRWNESREAKWVLKLPLMCNWNN